MPYRVRPNRRCLRGLHWEFVLDPAPDWESLAQALQHAFGEGMLRGEERYGSRRVIKLLVQFQCELRLGEWPRTLSLLHRQCAPQEIRARSRQRVETVLREVLMLTEVAETAEGSVDSELAE